jgi:hypothetical protein
VHRHQHRLLLRRLVSHGEQQSVAELQVVVGNGSGGDEFAQVLLDDRARGQVVKVIAGAGVLGGAPLLYGGVVPVFESAVVIRNFYAMIFVGDWVLGGGGRSGDGLRLDESGQDQQQDPKGST